jgi:hypothetical protein
MANIRLQLGHLNIAELIALGQQVHFAMHGNAAFAALKSQVGDLLNEINEMIITNDGYQKELQMIQQRLAERQGQRASLENLLTELAIGVENLSGGNTGLIPSTGFDVPTITAPTPFQLPIGMESVAATN